MSERLAAARAAWANARAEKSKTEFDALVEPLLFEHIGEYFEIECKDAPAEFPQWVVIRRPNAGEHARVMHVMFEDSRKNGAVEAKAKAGLQLGAQCRVYPEADEYARLVKAFPGVAAEVGKKAFQLAEAGADADAKS